MNVLGDHTELEKNNKLLYCYFCPCYLEFIQMATSFEACRKKWLQADEALGSCKEVLAKAETDRGSLEVKLKHARNQVDVEIRRRQKAEAEYEKLVGSFSFWWPLFRELLCD